MKAWVACLIIICSATSFGAGPELRFSRRAFIGCVGALLTSSRLFAAKTQDSKRYLVTFAQAERPITGAFIETLENYAKTNDANILVLVGGDSKKLPKRILESSLFRVHTEKFDLSPHVSVSPLPKVKTISPFDGVGMEHQPGALRLIAHPKIKSANARPFHNAEAPPMTLASTGSMNDLLADTHSMSATEIAQIPEPGAVYVEVDSQGGLHWKQLRFMFSWETGYSATVVDSN